MTPTLQTAARAAAAPPDVAQFDGVDLRALARAVGTPCHVYSAAAIRGRIGELLGELEEAVAAVLVARVGVGAEVVVVVPALEVLVVLDHPVDVVAHVGLDHLRGDGGMVGHAHRLADVVQQ